MSAVKPDWDEPRYWTEEAFLSLGETKNKIELIDGGLWVSPSANNPHNALLANLIPDLKRAARDAGLRALLVPNLRLARDRITVPDVAVGRFERTGAMNSAADAVLVVEITSPGDALVDRTVKKALYAEAKIDWYLLIEPDFADYRSAGLTLFRRQGAEFVAHAVAADGGRLVTEEPFRFGVDAAALVDF